MKRLALSLLASVLFSTFGFAQTAPAPQDSAAPPVPASVAAPPVPAPAALPAATPAGLSIKGHVITGILGNLTDSLGSFALTGYSLDVNRGIDFNLGSSSRLRLNLDYNESDLYGIKGRIDFYTANDSLTNNAAKGYNPFDAYLRVSYLTAYANLADTVKVTVGRQWNPGTFALKYATADDFNGVGSYKGGGGAAVTSGGLVNTGATLNDGLEILLSNKALLPGFTAGYFIPVPFDNGSVSSNNLDFYYRSFKGSDINLTYTIPGTLKASAGFLGLEAYLPLTGSTLAGWQNNKFYGLVQYLGSKELSAGVSFAYKTDKDFNYSGIGSGSEITATVGYILPFGLTIAQDVGINIANARSVAYKLKGNAGNNAADFSSSSATDIFINGAQYDAKNLSGDLVVNSATALRYTYNAAKNVVLIPQVELDYSQLNSNNYALALTPKLKTVLGSGKHEFIVGYVYRTGNLLPSIASSPSDYRAVFTSVQVNF